MTTSKIWACFAMIVAGIGFFIMTVDKSIPASMSLAFVALMEMLLAIVIAINEKK